MSAFSRPLPLIVAALGLLAPSAAWADSIQCEDSQPSDCLTVWQAHALGYLTITSASSSGVRVGIANGGDFDVCVEDQALYTADLSQSFFLDDDITDAGSEIAAGSALYTYYGSWTTPNGYYYPYYGNPPWWCVEYGQYATAGATYDYFGEQIPDALAYYISTATDTDGDGRTDKNDWAGVYGVQANYNIWAYQNSYAILTAGKLAQASGCDVEVSLLSRNIGYYGATGTLTDIVPEGWTASDYSAWPDDIVDNADGSTTLTWIVSVSGTYGGIILDSEQITYTLSHDSGSDVPYLELPEAWVTFDDGTGTETNYSLPAAAYNLDMDCDGTVSCVEEEICDGIDNDLDGEIDEGFDEDGDGFADCMEECVVEERFCSAEDGLNLLEDGTPAVLTYDANPRWTASISGAEWIWDEYYETNPGGDEIHSIFRAFSLQPGAWNLDISLEVGADNSYEVWLNGTSVGADPTEYNYFAPTDIWDLTGAGQDGDNSLEMEVWNWAQPGGTAYSNPGGLIYCVDVSYSYEMDPEICDGMDNDCDGLVDDDDPDITGQGTWYADTDGDGFGDPAVYVVSCSAPSGYAADGTDCDDMDAAVNPGASEICDGRDNDCDGLVDDADPDVVGQGTWYADADGDGYGDAGAAVTACAQPSGTVADATDCDDTAAVINPGAAELCDGLDNDCDGAVDEGFDSDSDGIADCFDTEECDGLDNDGDGLVDDLDPDVVGQGTWYVDADGDGYGDAGSVIVACAMPTGATTDDTDCDDTDAAVNPAVAEVCNGLDDDCDGDVDEGLDATWYADLDGDGYGDPSSAVEDCEAPTGYVADDTDCDDDDADINPGAAEECDGLDNDCDGLVDEDFDQDGDGYTTCGVVAECEVLFDLSHGEDTWSDPYNYTTEHAWGFAADALLAAGYGWEANASSTLDLSLMSDYDATIVAEPVRTFSSDEVDAVLDYVYDGGGLLLITDFNESYINSIASELGVSFHGYSDLIGWTAIDDWDTGHAVSDGISSVFWAYGSTMSVTDASIQVLATYDGRPVYAVLEYGDGRVVFSADNEVFAAYGFFQISDPDPSALRDNETLWMQTMDWLIDCPTAVDPDCDDTDPDVHPGAEEICNGIDDDCDAEVDEGYDEDGDGWTSCEGDCDDDAYGVNPDATEICDGLDDDCDGLVDDDDPDVTGQGTWYADGDGDGYGAAEVTACEQPAGTVDDDSDCNDSSAAVNPGADEICDGIDDDCDGLVDDADPSITGQGTWYEDADGDGYGGVAVLACSRPAGTVTDSTDCDDGDAAINPGSTEVCNGLDDDCDGLVDDDDPSVTGQGTWYADADGDGYGSTAVTACTQPSGTVDDDSDCDDADAAVNPGAIEVCNGLDDDCDGLVDDDDPSVTGQGTWYVDGDGDGYGATEVTSCTQPSGTVDDGTDCDDGEASVYPGATELCDELDNDCDGWTDEGDACVEDCPELEPADCLTVWQAHARGWLDITSSTSSVVTMTNLGPYDICIDEQVLYTSDDTQTFFADEDVVAAPAELAPGDSLSLYYGSWTTANGYHHPYLGNDAWWCVEYGQYTSAGAGFDWYGEEIPGTLAGFATAGWDEDGDGVDDLLDWAGTFGVQANYNVWDWQSGHAVLTAGKTASVGGGEVWVDLLSRNLGWDDGAGILTDTIPAGWTVTSWTVDPDTQTENADGSLTVTWAVDVAGTAGGLTVDLVDLSYLLERDCPSDLPYLELEAAWVAYFDGDSDVTSTSLPAAAYNIDGDGDGIVDCAEEEICDGIDNDLDCEIDEGFDEDGDGFADCMEECVITERFCSGEDGLNLLEDGTPAVLTYDGNPRWTVSITDAEWIWDEYYETNPGGDEIHSLFRGFGLQPGAWDVDATLEMGADNSYEVWLNGTAVGDDATEFNYFAPSDIWDLTTAVQEGDNALEWEVWNWAQPGGSAYSNPGGLLYCVDLSYSYEMDPEICDGMDNDCDGLIDDADPDITGQDTWYADADGDGFGDATDFVISCNAPSGYVFDDTDCDDTDAAINPGASEICNGIDDDCDGLVDDDDSDVVGQGTWYADADGDGFGDAGAVTLACVMPVGSVTDATDCDDTDAAVSPAAAEVCNGIDDDCDGLIDDLDPDVGGQSTWYADADGDSYGDAGSTTVACLQPSGFLADDTDCDDGDAAVNPGATEVCNGVDDDCDGDVDEGFDSDADGIADCFDTEECDGLDNDGDGLVDDDDPSVTDQSTWYVDADGDGYGDAGSTVLGCEPPSGSVGDDTDCDDGDAYVFPGGIEVCNEADDDCDGDVDEDLDCGAEDCAEAEPEECLTLWQAHARGWLWVESGENGAITFTNMGVYNVCIDEQGLYTSTGTQNMFVEGDIIGAIELTPGEHLTLQYGSWTTENETYQPFLGEDAWWCVANDTSTSAGYTFDWYGEETPVVLSTYVDGGWDVDGDGREDLIDWAGSIGVQAQYDIWDYQVDNPVLTAGKLAEAAGIGIEVTLVARNVGYIDGSGELSDIVPAGWSMASTSVTPDSEVDNGDGTVTVSWAVDVAGMTSSGVLDADTFTYLLERDCPSDAPYTELAEASVAYEDTVGAQVSWSMPAAVYNLDVSGDGILDCPEEELCDGLDNDLDCAVDEGFDSDADGIADCFDTEECDGVDNDGDGLVDDDDPDVIGQDTWYLDQDGDGYGKSATTVVACSQPSGYAAVFGDCDDSAAAVNPAATEVCNGYDDDCDGLVDDADASVIGQATWYADADSDGFGDPAVTSLACEKYSGWSGDRHDCDDGDAAINPAAVETCNGYDDDCDGAVDDADDHVAGASTWYADVDGDGYGDLRGHLEACEAPSGFLADHADCDDGDAEIHPGAEELCDGVDQDCDGVVDEDDVCVGEVCEEEPPEDCLTLWQAHASGWLEVDSSSTDSGITFTNMGPYDICLDGRALYTSPTTQDFFLDAAVIDLPAEIPTDSSYTAWYGSWTTENDVYAPYYGEPAWWCAEHRTAAGPASSFSYYGEAIPDVLTTWVDEPQDADGDGVDDLVDWAGSGAVQAQLDIWDWEGLAPVMTVGKVAEEAVGDVAVTLTSRNLGDLPGEGWLVDTVPAGWLMVAAERYPDLSVLNADGSLTMAWFVELDAFRGGHAVTQFSYTMTRELTADVPYLELAAASLTYEETCALDATAVFPPDCEGEASWSLPAAVYGVDVDQDDVLTCLD